jgi:hypothetical protein
MLYFCALEHYGSTHARDHIQDLTVEIEPQFAAFFQINFTIEISDNSKNPLVTKSVVQILLYSVDVT